MKKTSVVHFRDFDVNRLVVPDSPKETATEAKIPEGKGKAFEIKLRYKHVEKTEDGKILENEGTLLVQGPELFTPYGVKPPKTKDVDDNGKNKLSVFVVFDKDNKDHQDYIGTIGNAYRLRKEDEEEILPSGFLGIIYDWGCGQLYNFFKYQERKPVSKEMIGEFLNEKSVIMQKRYDEEDNVDEKLIGTVIPDNNATKYLSLRTFGIPGTASYNVARFVTLSGEDIPLEKLADIKFRFVPHIIWRRIWIGQFKAFTHEITGAIVTEIIESVKISLVLENARKSLLSRVDEDRVHKIDEMLKLDKKLEATVPETTSIETIKDEDDEDEKPILKSSIKDRLQGLKNK